jgi:hypothetical protein
MMTTYTFRGDGRADEYRDGRHVGSWVVCGVSPRLESVEVILARPPAEIKRTRIGRRQFHAARRAEYAARYRPDFDACMALVSDRGMWPKKKLAKTQIP